MARPEQVVQLQMENEFNKEHVSRILWIIKKNLWATVSAIIHFWEIHVMLLF